MMGRFIISTMQCQAQCRSTSDYDFPERERMRNLLLANCLMDDEVSYFFDCYLHDDLNELFVDAKVAHHTARRRI